MARARGAAAIAIAWLLLAPAAWSEDGRSAAWAVVASAATPGQQERALESFIDDLAASGKPAGYVLTAEQTITGERRGFEDGSVLARPRDHVLTLALDGKAYRFQPLSARAVTLLLRE